MKKYIFYFSILCCFWGCKKETPQPQYKLSISFEKEGKEFSFEGTEYSHNPSFHNSKEEAGNSSSIFTLKSWSKFQEVENKGSSLTINVIQFDTSSHLSKIGLDKIFSLGEMDLTKPAFTVVPDDSISHSVSIEYTTNNATYKKYYNRECSSSEQSYFEIIKVDEVTLENGVHHIIIEAEFDLVLCSDDGEKLELKNGNLRYYFKVFFG